MKKPISINHLEVSAKTEELNRTVDFITEFLRIHGFDQKSILQTSIAAEEIFTNICRYAYSPESGSIMIDIWIDAPSDRATIRFSDCGRAFDPLSAKPPDITLPDTQRTEGGLGIFMMQKLVSHVEYHYKNGMNILTITKQKSMEAETNGNHAK